MGITHTYAQDTLNFNELTRTLYEHSEYEKVNFDEMLTPITLEDFQSTVKQRVERVHLDSEEIEALDSTDFFFIRTRKGLVKLYADGVSDNFFSYHGYYHVLKSYHISYCIGGTCDDYLLDTLNAKMLQLPCFYDWGVEDFEFSLKLMQLAITSSYDSPEWDNVSSERSYIYLLKIDRPYKKPSVKPYKVLVSKEWSIQNLIWKDESTLYLRLYNQNRTQAELNSLFYYFKVRVGE